VSPTADDYAELQALISQRVAAEKAVQEAKEAVDWAPNEESKDLAESRLWIAESDLKEATAGVEAKQAEIDQAIAAEQQAAEASPGTPTAEQSHSMRETVLALSAAATLFSAALNDHVHDDLAKQASVQQEYVQQEYVEQEYVQQESVQPTPDQPETPDEKRLPETTKDLYEAFDRSERNRGAIENAIKPPEGLDYEGMRHDAIAGGATARTDQVQAVSSGVYEQVTGDRWQGEAQDLRGATRDCLASVYGQAEAERYDAFCDKYLPEKSQELQATQDQTLSADQQVASEDYSQTR
jgi:hypothetical protein